MRARGLNPWPLAVAALTLMVGRCGGSNSSPAAPSIQVLYSFDGANSGADPKGTLTLVEQNKQWLLFGRTSSGGAANGGTVFGLPINPAGNLAVAPLDSSGDMPHHDAMLPVLNNSLSLWGTTLSGGDSKGDGTIFTVDPASFIAKPGVSIVYDFKGKADSGPDGAEPHSTFALSGDGTTLYGATAKGGSNGGGTLYSFPAAGGTASDKVLFNFNAPGASDVCTIAAGTCPAQLPAGCNAALTGDTPHGRPLVIHLANSDVLLGMTRQGGLANLPQDTVGNGVIYAYYNGNYAVLHYFLGAACGDGAYTDHGNLISGAIGENSSGIPTVTVYGMTTDGGTGTLTDGGQPLPGSGVLFQAVISLGATPQLQSYTTLHRFGMRCDAKSGVGCVPDTAGNLIQDGFNPYGSLLAQPSSRPLVNSASSWLYGMTRNGGAYAGAKSGGGVIFRLQTNCQPGQTCYQVVASFDIGGPRCDPSAPTPTTCDTSGSRPIDNLIADSSGDLFGMTQAGGTHDLTDANSYGTIFEITPPPPP